jgi:hypothetical protein
MTPLFRSGLRRATALALLIAPILLTWQLVCAPLLERYVQTEDAIDRSVQLLSRYRANAGEKEKLAAELVTRRQNVSANRSFIEAPNQPLAASTLQGSLRRLLEANGASIRTLSVQPPVRDAGFDRLIARVEFGVDADRLIGVLHGIESATAPNLTIDSLDIRAPDQGIPAQKAEANTSLTVRLDAAGYWVVK